MQQQRTICQLIDHQRDYSEYICIYQKCDQQSRQLCQKCIQSHDHQKKSQLDNNYILSVKQFLERVNQKQSLIIKHSEKLNIAISNIKQIIESIQSIIKKLISQLDQIQYDNKKEEEFYTHLINKINDKYWQIQDDELQKIMENDQNKYFQQLQASNTFLQQVIEDCQKILYIVDEQKHDELKQLRQQKFQDFKNFKEQYTINIAQISHNEKYLVLGGENQEVTIKNLKQNNNHLSIKLQSFIKTCKFSLNDQYLYCGEISGNLSVYDVEQDLKQIYQKKIHTQAINNLIINQFLVISCSDDMSIIITDIKNRKCTLQIQNAHSNTIYGLEYDKQNQIIISSSKDLSIKFFNSQNGELQINNQMSHDSFIMQIQLIRSNERLISASFYELKIWSINLAKGQIIVIQSLVQKNIYNFSSIKNDSLIIVVTQDFLNIFDQSLGLVRNFLHNKDQNKFLTYYQTKQLTSMKYIIIMGQRNCQLLSQENKL